MILDLCVAYVGWRKRPQKRGEHSHFPPLAIRSVIFHYWFIDLPGIDLFIYLFIYSQGLAFFTHAISFVIFQVRQPHPAVWPVIFRSCISALQFYAIGGPMRPKVGAFCIQHAVGLFITNTMCHVTCTGELLLPYEIHTTRWAWKIEIFDPRAAP